MELLADVKLIPADTAPEDARRVVREVLPDDLAQDVLEDVLVVVTELVSFKLAHGRIAPEGFIGLRLLRDGVVRLEIEGAESLPLDPWIYQRWNRAMALISRRALRWGVIHGKRVTAWVDFG